MAGVQPFSQDERLVTIKKPFQKPYLFQAQQSNSNASAHRKLSYNAQAGTAGDFLGGCGKLPLEYVVPSDIPWNTGS